jgi:hypothetical protein
MRILQIYVLIFLVSLNNYCFQQVLRLPLLCQHFSEHKQADDTLDVYNFLAMHYLGNDIDDKDQKKDNELPFKHTDSHSFQSIFLLGDIVGSFNFITHMISHKSIRQPKQLCSIVHHNLLLRPPRY